MPSYSPVFSAAFIQYTPSTPNNEFLVPAGFTAVVRQVSAAQNIGGWVFEVSIQDATSAPPLVIVELGQVGDFNYVAQEGRWVAPEGATIIANLSALGSAISLYVGGYLLRNNLT